MSVFCDGSFLADKLFFCRVLYHHLKELRDGISSPSDVFP